ncbi:MAG: HAMP domain-containing sensor histidine kinase [Patescibacteria group bacterium]
MQQLCPWEPAQYFIFSSNVPTLLYYSHLTAVLTAVIFALVLLPRIRESLPVKLFIMTILFFTAWTVIDLPLWALNRPDIDLFLWSVQVLAEVLVYVTAFYFAYTFIVQKDLRFLWKLGLIILLAPIIVLLPTSYLFPGVDLATCVISENPLLNFSFTYGIEILLIFLILFTSFRGTGIQPNRKKEIILFTTGIIVFLVAFSSGNIIGSVTENWDLAQVGLFGMPVFIAFLAYTVVKFKTFNSKVIAAQALIATLAISIFSLLFVQTISTIRIIAGATFALVCIVGYNLVRGVKREIGLSDQLSEFMSLATHEIRNPATYIRGSAMGALEGDLGELTPAIKDTMQKIFIRVNDIIHLGNQYLDKSKLELNKITYEFVSTDLAKLTKDLVREFEPAAAQRGITITSNIDKSQSYEAQVDNGKIKEVIGNLIDNAIKYTKERNNGSVTVSVVKGEDIVTIKIADTGDGIPAKTIPELFKKFSRADAEKANLLGTGLGLYLAKIFINAHQGKIWVESPGKDKGSTFFVELPIIHVPNR